MTVQNCCARGFDVDPVAEFYSKATSRYLLLLHFLSQCESPDPMASLAYCSRSPRLDSAMMASLLLSRRTRNELWIVCKFSVFLLGGNGLTVVVRCGSHVQTLPYVIHLSIQPISIRLHMNISLSETACCF